MGDLEEAISFILKKKVKKVAVLGHSLGAVVSILQSCRDSRVKSLCVLGAPESATSLQKLFSKSKIDEIDEKGKANVSLFSKPYVITKEFLKDTEIHDLKKALSNAYDDIASDISLYIHNFDTGVTINVNRLLRVDYQNEDDNNID